MADGVTRAAVSLAIACPPAERLLLAAALALRGTAAGRAFWWRVRPEFVRRWAAMAGDADLRWVRIPGSGARMLIHARSEFGCLHFAREPYEAPTADFLRGALKPGDVFLDAGANAGYFTMLAAGIVGGAGRAVAFEPNPEPRGLLERSAARNGFGSVVTAMDCALCDRDGEAAMSLPRDAWASVTGSLSPWEGHAASGRMADARSIRVRCRRLDSLAPELGLARIDAVKIDVEGAELAALTGARETLARCRPRFIVCETCLAGDVADMLGGMGYDASPLQYHVPAKRWGNVLFRLRAP